MFTQIVDVFQFQKTFNLCWMSYFGNPLAYRQGFGPQLPSIFGLAQSSGTCAHLVAESEINPARVTAAPWRANAAPMAAPNLLSRLVPIIMATLPARENVLLGIMYGQHLLYLT